MSAAVIRKRSHFEEQQNSSPRSKRIRPAQSRSPIWSLNHAERLTSASQSEGATQASSHGDMDSSFLPAMVDHSVQMNAERQSEPACAHVQSESEEWVEHLVKEMMHASDVNDARLRGKHALEAVEKVVTSRSLAAIDGWQKENVELKEKLQVLLKESHILKRAVAIQHERQQEHEGRSRELQQAKQALGQYQEQVRTLELNNYSLRMHLRMAQEGSSMPGRLHPDVF